MPWAFEVAVESRNVVREATMAILLHQPAETWALSWQSDPEVHVAWASWAVGHLVGGSWGGLD